MPLSRRTVLKLMAGTTGASSLGLLPNRAWAAYPDRPIRLVVPFAAGGNADTQGRVIAFQMQRILGQAVVIDNRAGAGGGIGAEAVARSAPDGYTLLLGSNGPMTVNPLVQKVGYDTFKDFAPVAFTSYVPHTIIVGSKVEAKSVAELVALSKKKSITVGIAGVGSATYMTLVRFQAATGAELTAVPYRGGGALVPDLIGGHLQAAFTEFSTAFPLHKDGRVRILAVAAEKRISVAPEIPTMIESGANVTAESFTGILAPAGTPKEVISLLEKTIARGMAEGGSNKLRELGAEIATDMSAAGLAAYLKMDFERTKVAAELAGLARK
jgi:tripartite-type tricarboxylate transporter receptor subunit TctC